jgi:hypothetical protein
LSVMHQNGRSRFRALMIGGVDLLSFRLDVVY